MRAPFSTRCPDCHPAEGVPQVQVVVAIVLLIVLIITPAQADEEVVPASPPAAEPGHSLGEAWPRPGNLPPPPDDPSAQIQDKLSQLLEAVESDRHQLRGELQAVVRGTAPTAHGSESVPHLLQRLQRDLDETSGEWSTQMQDLRNNLGHLRRAMERQVTQPPSEPTPNNIAPNPPLPETDNETPPLAEAGDPADTTAPSSEPIASTAPGVILNPPLTEAPIDRMALADQLFASGDYSTALDVYREINVEQLEVAEGIWIQHQIASCFRRLGNSVEADKYYRDIAGNKTDEVLAQNAMWWLKTMQSYRDAKSRFDQTQEFIASAQGSNDEQ